MDLLNFISQLFPELSFVANYDDFGLVLEKSRESLQCRVNDITDDCGCPSCSTKANRVVDLAPICKTRFALTLVRLIFILCPVTIHESVPPSVMALRQLYNCTQIPVPGTSARAISCNGLHLIHSLFTGADLDQPSSTKVSAVCGKGVCIFYSILRSIELSPAEAMHIEVIPGQIRHDEYCCKYVTDISLEPREHIPSLEELKEIHYGSALAKSIELIAERKVVDKAIAASYRFLSVDSHPVFLNTATLQEALLNSLRMDSSHADDCDGNLEVEPGPRRWSLSESYKNDSLEALKSVRITESSLTPSWAIVTWQAWNTSKIGGKSYQNLEIDIYRPHIASLFLLISYLHLKQMQDSRLPHSQRRECILVAEIADCSSCIVQKAATAWYKATKEKQPFVEEIARFNDALKLGLIKKKSLIGVEADSELKFVLASELVNLPVGSTTEPKRNWTNLWGRAGRERF